MKKKTIILSIGAAVFLTLASLSSVIVFATSQSQNQQRVGSPLFHIRTSRSIGQQNDQTIQTMYIGKGKMTSLFLTKLSTKHYIMERGLQLLKTSPELIKKSIQRVLQNSQVQQTLQKNGITEQQVMQYFNQMKNSPDVVAAQFDGVAGLIPQDGGPRPMGLLNTSNPFACVIVIISLLPVLLIVGLLIATLTLVTCLNVNNCFDNLMDNILQGLRQP